MKLFEAFRESGYHTTIATTFAIDFTAYEQIALARLRETGCMNNIVLADARMLTWSLDDGERSPRQAGRQYSLVGAEAPGLFHPKLTLQLGVDRARLIVASANLTGSGLAGNLEVVGEVRMGPDDDAHVGLMQEALAFLEQYVPASEQGARKQLEWARARAAWLQRAAPARDPLAPRLLATGGGAAIGERFTEFVAGESVSRLVVLSPYWDENLAAVRSLQAALKPRKTALLIQPHRALFPGKKGLKAQLFAVGSLAGPRDRFAHAKVVIVQTKRADHVLFGSTNCTVAALGAGVAAGANVEAALYRRMAAGAAVEALGLGDLLEGQPLDDDAVAPYARAEEIPLEQAAARQPGRFHLRGRQLTWTPAPAYDKPDAQLELLDVDQHLLLAAPVTIEGTGRVLQLELAEAPRFARARVGQHVSAVGVIHIEEELLQNMRVMSSKKIQNGLDKLAGGEVEGLFLYEALEMIDAEESRFAAAAASRGGARKRAPATGPAATLTYDEFMRARASGPAPDRVPGNTLASSYVNEVRAFLNVLIGVDEARLGVADVGDSALAMPLGLGDETADGESALESGGYDEQEITPPPAPDEATPTPAQREADTERAISAAVKRFNERLDVAARHRELTTRDLLRVRVLLTVILASGTTRVLRSPPNAGASVPVLLARGDDGWPRLAGQVLFKLFGTEMPAMHQVKLEADESGQVPVDLLECFATCMWTVAALALSRDERSMATEVAHHALKRAAEMYGMTILEPKLLGSDAINKVMLALSERYAKRLGVDSAELMALHARMVATAPALRAQWLAARQPDHDDEESLEVG